MNAAKSGFVSIIGRPNVGKSTLLNKILGQKIVITTDKPQTTRKRIKGILTRDEGQIVFVDTPGVHKPLDKLGEILLDEAKFSVPDTDLTLFVVDGSLPAGKGDKWIAQNMLSGKSVIIVMNKVDKGGKTDENLLTYKTLFDQNYPLVKVSAKTGKNLDALLEKIFEHLPQGGLIYPEDVVTEESMRDIVCEIVREKILLNTSDEIPHAVAVKIEKYEETDAIDRIYANIYCEAASQKGILIGKGGAMLKKIGTEARLELETITDKKVFLSLEVKVEKDWRKKNAARFA